MTNREKTDERLRRVPENNTTQLATGNVTDVTKKDERLEKIPEEIVNQLADSVLELSEEEVFAEERDSGADPTEEADYVRSVLRELLENSLLRRKTLPPSKAEHHTADAVELHSQSPIHVLVSDNSNIHSHLLAEALKRDHRLRIVGSASSSREFIEIAASQLPDVVIVSANLDDDPLGGVATLREFHEAHPKIPAVMLLDSPKREIVLDAIRAGARGIFSKHESLETLCKCVRVVYEGQVWASSRDIKFALGLNLLSTRELEVVQCLAEGLTDSEIGKRMGLSRHTIKNYLLRIFDKLGVSNRVELLFLTLAHRTEDGLDGTGGSAPPDGSAPPVVPVRSPRSRGPLPLPPRKAAWET